VLRSKIVGREFAIGEDAYTLAGSTRQDDLDTHLQLLAAYVTHPGWRTAAFERMRKAAPTILDQLDATPAGVHNRDLGQRAAFGSQDQRTSIQRQAAGRLAGLAAQRIIGVGDARSGGATGIGIGEAI